MKMVYLVKYMDADNEQQEMEFVDLKEALSFIEGGLHFVGWFQIQKVKR